MARFNVEDILTIGEVAGDRSALTAMLGEMIHNSSNLRADVESLSTQTGEFRVVLQGTLDGQPPIWEQRERAADPEWAGDAEGVAEAVPFPSFKAEP